MTTSGYFRVCPGPQVPEWQTNSDLRSEALCQIDRLTYQLW